MEAWASGCSSVHTFVLWSQGHVKGTHTTLPGQPCRKMVVFSMCMGQRSPNKGRWERGGGMRR